MSVSSGFFNSVEGDRTYDAIQFSSIFDGMINDGVFEDFGDAFAVTPGVGLSVIVGTGRCWFNHTWTYNSTPITMTLDSSSPDGSRWDAIALKIDHSEDVRENSIIKVNGAPSANPSKPSFTPTSTVFYYPIAYVKVNQSASSIGTDNIEMVVGTEVCPYATIVSSGVNFDILAIEKGGTGNTTGLIDAGRKAGTEVGTCSTAEGYETTASGDYSHAEGYKTVASKFGAHAEGDSNIATGNQAHAEGMLTEATGDKSHAEGCKSKATGFGSHAGGEGTIAGAYQTAIGEYNVENNEGFFIVGCGDSSTRANCFRAARNYTYGKSYQTSGADYAEMFEWADGNPYDEDRIGLFVTLDGDKIRIANSSDNFILGITSGVTSVTGDEGDEWHSMYVTDIYGRPHMVETLVPAIISDDGRIISPEHYEYKAEINPDYDPSEKYIHRKDRKEWDTVGLMGKLVLNDDGTASVNDYVWPSYNGIATKSNTPTKFRVMERLDETHIKVITI